MHECVTYHTISTLFRITDNNLEISLNRIKNLKKINLIMAKMLKRCKYLNTSSKINSGNSSISSCTESEY